MLPGTIAVETGRQHGGKENAGEKQTPGTSLKEEKKEGEVSSAQGAYQKRSEVHMGKVEAGIRNSLEGWRIGLLAQTLLF